MALLCVGLSVFAGGAGSPFRPYGGLLFFSRKKVSKKFSPHQGSTLRFEFPYCGVATGHCELRVASNSTFRNFGSAEGAARLPLRNTFIRPYWLTGRVDQDQRQIKVRSTIRFALAQQVCGVAAVCVGAGVACDGLRSGPGGSKPLSPNCGEYRGITPN